MLPSFGNGINSDLNHIHSLKEHCRVWLHLTKWEIIHRVTKRTASIVQMSSISSHVPFAARFCRVAVFLAMLFIMYWSSYSHGCRHSSDGDLSNCLNIEFEVFAVFSGIGSVFTVAFHKDKVQIIIDAFQKTFDQRK